MRAWAITTSQLEPLRSNRPVQRDQEAETQRHGRRTEREHQHRVEDLSQLAGVAWQSTVAAATPMTTARIDAATANRSELPMASIGGKDDARLEANSAW